MENITPSAEQIRSHIQGLPPREQEAGLDALRSGALQHFLEQVRSTPLQELISENLVITIPVANIGGRVVNNFAMGVTMRYFDGEGNLLLSNGTHEVSFSQAVRDNIAALHEMATQEK